jgi:hypothetical protein
MSTNILVGWVMAGDPSYPVLLYAGNRDSTKFLDEAQRVREVSEGIARQCKIYQTVHVGTYIAYLSVLGNCLIERADLPETEKKASTP